MSRAKDDMMDMLHLLTAEKLADIIRNGIEMPLKGEEGGTITVPAPAAYIAAAIKFLKDNGITSEPNSKRLADLKDGMEDVPLFDEDEEFDHSHMN